MGHITPPIKPHVLMAWVTGMCEYGNLGFVWGVDIEACMTFACEWRAMWHVEWVHVYSMPFWPGVREQKSTGRW